MPRPTARTPAAKKAKPPGLSKLPPPPKSMSRPQAAAYKRLGELMVDAGTLTAMCLPMLEATARVSAALDDMYSDRQASRPTIAAFARMLKEHLVQLGMGAAALGGARPARSPESEDAEARRYGSLIE